MTNSRNVLPPAYFFLSAGAMMLFHFVLPAIKIIQPPWNLLGIIPFVAGSGFNLVADRAFKKYRTTVKSFEESAILVTGGLFRMSRNPMYLGFVLILTGIAIFMGSLTPFAVIIIFIVLINTVFIKVEESMLKQKFGNTWLEYERKVRRWI